MMWTLIPAKPFAEAKTRLAGLLGPEQRAALAAGLLARTIAVARAAVGDAPLAVVSWSDSVGAVARAAGADHALLSRAVGLNAQLADVAARAVPADAALFVLHADLPWLEAEDVAAMIASEATVTLAPDGRGRGTNALLHRRPSPFFRFGPDSLADHRAEAAARAQAVALVCRPGLAFDLDDPEDWRRCAPALPATAVG